MGHVIDADDVENELSEETRKSASGETPAELKHEVKDVQGEPTPNRDTPTMPGASAITPTDRRHSQTGVLAA